MEILADGLPAFHTFREMCAHLLTDGAAHRYGNLYPIYVGKEIERRTWNSSHGECVERNFGAGIAFTLEEQFSVNWVLIPADEWKAREERMQQWYRTNAEAKRRAGG